MELRYQAYKNLEDLHLIMLEAGVDFFLMDGTLLGIYRDGDLIAGDYDDIDVGIFKKDEPKMKRIIETAEKYGFQLFKQFKLKGNTEGISIKRWANHIDIFLVHRKGDEAFNLGRNCCKIGSLDYMAYVYPAECFEKLDEIFFAGVAYKIPTQTGKFLEARYNKDWQKPHLRSEGFNMCSIEQNNALKGDYDYA